MNLDQYTNLIRAISLLGMVFIAGWITKSCLSKNQINEQQKQLPFQYEQQIIQIDSSIHIIPFTISDSERTNYLNNYRKIR
jgi:hypothetical protein